MDDLEKEGIKSGKLADPEGYCHFPDWIDELFFKQLTSEYIDDQLYRGRVKRVWKQRYRANHFLDCRVYNIALLSYLGFDKMTADDWSGFERERGAPALQASRDPVFRPTIQVAAHASGVETASPEPTSVAPKLSWREAVDKFKRDAAMERRNV